MILIPHKIRQNIAKDHIYFDETIKSSDIKNINGMLYLLLNSENHFELIIMSTLNQYERIYTKIVQNLNALLFIENNEIRICSINNYNISKYKVVDSKLELIDEIKHNLARPRLMCLNEFIIVIYNDKKIGFYVDGTIKWYKTSWFSKYMNLQIGCLDNNIFLIIESLKNIKLYNNDNEIGKFTLTDRQVFLKNDNLFIYKNKNLLVYQLTKTVKFLFSMNLNCNFIGKIKQIVCEINNLLILTDSCFYQNGYLYENVYFDKFVIFDGKIFLISAKYLSFIKIKKENQNDDYNSKSNAHKNIKMSNYMAFLAWQVMRKQALKFYNELSLKFIHNLDKVDETTINILKEILKFKEKTYFWFLENGINLQHLLSNYESIFNLNFYSKNLLTNLLSLEFFLVNPNITNQDHYFYLYGVREYPNNHLSYFRKTNKYLLKCFEFLLQKEAFNDVYFLYDNVNIKRKVIKILFKNENLLKASSVDFIIKLLRNYKRKTDPMVYKILVKKLKGNYDKLNELKNVSKYVERYCFKNYFVKGVVFLKRRNWNIAQLCYKKSFVLKGKDKIDALEVARDEINDNVFIYKDFVDKDFITKRLEELNRN